MVARQWTLPLPYTRPPLTLNQRLHWRHRDRITRELRDHLWWMVRKERIPTLARAEVRLTYAPNDRRRRDVDNLVPTSKACLDAIVRAGVLPDDSPEFVEHLMPRIDPPSPYRAPTPHGRVLYVTVTDLTTTETTPDGSHA